MENYRQLDTEMQEVIWEASSLGGRKQIRAGQTPEQSCKCKGPNSNGTARDKTEQGEYPMKE